MFSSVLVNVQVFGRPGFLFFFVVSKCSVSSGGSFVCLRFRIFPGYNGSRD